MNQLVLEVIITNIIALKEGLLPGKKQVGINSHCVTEINDIVIQFLSIEDLVEEGLRVFLFCE